MRGMRGINRNCRRCGKPFTVDGKTGGKCYCSTECRDAARKELQSKYNRTAYKSGRYYENVKPRELTCKGCGKSFIGYSRQAYCHDCLNLPGWYMRQLRERRSARFEVET